MLGRFLMMATKIYTEAEAYIWIFTELMRRNGWIVRCVICVLTVLYFRQSVTGVPLFAAFRM
jgi:hypothetical protein